MGQSDVELTFQERPKIEKGQDQFHKKPEIKVSYESGAGLGFGCSGWGGVGQADVEFTFQEGPKIEKGQDQYHKKPEIKVSH